MYCRNCGKEVGPQAVVCVNCGVTPMNGVKFCNNCGGETDPHAEFCTKCGVRLAAQNAGYVPGSTTPTPGYAGPAYVNPANADPNAKSKMVAGLLGIFLGWLGIHRFYLGYQNIAIAQLIVGVVGLILSPFTCGLIVLGASIWGLVDGVMILTGSINKDGQGRPLKD
jgi:TM2 domain-containing membrane protein YozV